jgi:hypothetical protein
MYVSYELREAAMARARILRARTMHRITLHLSRMLVHAFKAVLSTGEPRRALKT